MFSEDLPDIHFHQLLDILNNLDKPFREYIIQQVKLLAEAVSKSKKLQKSKKRTKNKNSNYIEPESS